MTRRLKVLLLLLALGIVLRLAEPSSGTPATEVVAATPRAAPAPRIEIDRLSDEVANRTSTVAGVDSERPMNAQRAPMGEAKRNLFASTVPPPPRAPKAPPALPPAPPPRPPPPQAPPLPFKVIGQWVEDGTPTIFVAGIQGTLKVKPGDIVADQFRVDQVASNRATFVYVPMNHRYDVPLPVVR